MMRDGTFRGRHSDFRGSLRASSRPRRTLIRRELSKHRRVASTLGLVLLVVLGVTPSVVRAQSANRAPSYGPGQDCFPTCRAGYVCYGGQCVSACNPACPGGEVCTPEGSCVSACNPPCERGERCESDGSCRPESPRAYDRAAHGTPPASEGFAPAVSEPVAPVALTPAYPLYPRRELQPPPGNDPRERGPLGAPSRIWFELSSFVNTQTSANDDSVNLTTVVQTPELHANIGFARRFRLDAVLPFSAAFLSPSQGDSGSAFRVGNPSASFQFVLPIGRRGWLSLGIGLALPVASLPDDRLTEDGLAARAAYGFGMAVHGLWNAWNYLPERFSLYVPVEIELGSARFRYAGEMAVAQAFYIGDGDADEVTIWQIGARIQAYVSRSVSFGARSSTSRRTPRIAHKSRSSRSSTPPSGTFSWASASS
jgi:hypothetical protein